MKAFKPSAIVVGLLLSAGIAFAGEQPQQKPGLWRRTSQTTEDGKTDGPQTSQRCMDAATLEKAKKMAADMASRCSKHDARFVGGVWTDDSVCSIGKTTFTVHAETRVSGENKYHTESETTYSPALDGHVHSRTVADGVWLGECQGK